MKCPHGVSPKSNCDICRKAYGEEYRKTHKSHIVEHKKLYYQRPEVKAHHKEYMRKYMKIYNKRPEVKAYYKAYYQRYYQKHKDKYMKGV